ncbi:MAG: ABC transporter permease [Candidatus Humimicrobiaceae bacterium]
MGSILKKYVYRYNAVIFVYIFLIIIFLGFSIGFPIFRSSKNLTNILIQIVPLAMVSIGQTIVLIGGGVDLTVGSVISLTTVIMANFLGDVPSVTIIRILFVFAIAIVIGIINGFICNETKIAPLIVTLCTSSVIDGAVLAYRMSPGGIVPKELGNFINFKFGIVSVSTLIVVVLYIIFITIMSRSTFGIHVYAMGGNSEFAKMAGINVKRVRIMTYIISACLACVTGIVIAARMGSGLPTVGAPFLIDSLTAVIIGGTGFSGGHGFVLGTLAGAVMISVISNALNMANVSPFYQYIAKGAILLIAMIINSRKK